MATDNSSKAPAKNRGDLVDDVAALTELSKGDVDKVIKAYEETIATTLAQGGDVRLTGFGVWKVSHRAARTSRNPRTGEPVDVPARTSPKFQPGKTLVMQVESGGKGPEAAVSQTGKSSKGGRGPGKNVAEAAAAKTEDAPKTEEAPKPAKAKAPAKKKK